MKKFLILTILVLLLLCSCNKEEIETYRITDEKGTRSIVSYGVIACEDIIQVTLPGDAYNIKCSSGQTVKCGDVLAEHNQKGTTKQITADHNGIIFTPKKSKENCIYYYNLDNVTISTYVAESDIKYVKIGDTVTVKGEGLQKPKYSGVISQLSPTAKKEANGTFVECKITLKDPDLSIIPGFSVKIENTITLENAVKIPVNAVSYDSNGIYVTVIENKKQVKRYIEEVLFNGGEYSICTGLKSNEVLLISQ